MTIAFWSFKINISFHTSRIYVIQNFFLLNRNFCRIVFLTHARVIVTLKRENL